MKKIRGVKIKKVIVLVSLMISILASYSNAQEELLLKTLKGHTRWGGSVSFSPDGKHIASGSGDKTIRLWSVETGECIKILTGHTDPVESVSFSPDGKYIASGSNDGTIKLWSVETGECIKTLGGHTYDGDSISFSPDGKYIASGRGTTIKLWSLKTGECINTLTGHTEWGCSVSFSPDGKYIASGSWDNTIKLWSVKTNECIKTLTGHTKDVQSVSFSPDGKYIASGSKDKTIKLWSVDSGECIKTLGGHTKRVESVSFSPDGEHIASGSWDKTIKLWSLKTGECMKTLTGHTKWVESVSFSPDGKYIASGSYDKTIKLWDCSRLIKFVYISSIDTELKSPTGKVLTKLPIGTKIEVERIEKNYLYVKVSETLKGWVKMGDISFGKPDMMKPVVRIVEKSFKEPNLYLKGVAYDDKKIVTVKFGDLGLERASFEVEKGNYEDVYPFEVKITLTPGMKLVLEARDRSGKIATVPINIEEPIIDYTPKYVHLEVKEKTPVRKEPSTYSEVLTKVNEKTVLVAIGHKDDWYYLEGGGWIYSSMVKEKEVGIKEVVSAPVEVKGKREKEAPRILRKPVDVDVDIPEGKTNPDAIGVIICIKDYENKDVPEVEYALNDGETMKNYFIKLFGIKDENIIFIENAKKSDFERLFGTEKDYRGQVYNWVKPQVSDVFIYYVGHGAPDVGTKEAYFLPSDAHPNYVRLNGYPMDTLYVNLSKIPARSVTLITDACFSGQSEKGMLIERASGIAIVPRTKFTGTLLTASSGEEVASWYPEKRHSLFTYFFLKGLKGEADKDKDKKITIEEIGEYIKDKVSYYARRKYNREQTPEFHGDVNKAFVSYR